MAACPTQLLSIASSFSLATAGSNRLAAVPVPPPVVLPFPADCSLAASPPSPPSSRSSSRQLFSQPSSASVAPPNTPTGAARRPALVGSEWQSGPAWPAVGLGPELPVHFDHRTGHQQLLRYLSEKQAAAQRAHFQQPFQYRLNHRSLLQQQVSPSGKDGRTKPAMSAFGHFSSLPPPLSYPPQPAAFLAELGPSSPASPSPIERAAHSYSTAGSLLCQSPSSTLSSSSHLSLDEPVDFDMDVDLLADHFQLPMQLLSPRPLLVQRTLHHSGTDAPTMLSGGRPAAAATGAYQLPNPPAVSNVAADEVPALPISGDVPPGSLQWQRELQELEKHELWSHTAQQLIASTLQQQQAAVAAGQWRLQQPYRTSEHDSAEGEEATHGSEYSEEAGGAVSVSDESGGGCEGSGSDESEAAAHNSRLAQQPSSGSRSRSSRTMASTQKSDSDSSSEDDAERALPSSSSSSRRTARHSKARRGRGKSSSRHKRQKKRRRSQRKEDSTDDSDSDEDREKEEGTDEDDDGDQHGQRGDCLLTRRAVGEGMGDSSPPQSPSSQQPLYSPSPSSFSTSTAASCSSTAASTGTGSPALLPPHLPSGRTGSGGRSARRSFGGHRSKLPARVVAVLRSFFLQHVSHPFPSDEQKRALVSRTALSMKQVCDWFTNNRKRYWKPYERKMDSLHCGLVGPHYRTEQLTAANKGRGRLAHRDRGRGGARGQKRQRDSRPLSEIRPFCRCGEENVAIHDWRQMWD